MVLVDTSVWIRGLRNIEPFISRLGRLLTLDQVIGHELVYGELLIGDRSGRGHFLALYEKYPQAPPVAHAAVVEFVRARRLNGRGVGWIDVHLLASAVVGGFQLWTADSRFADVATELGVAYKL